jgi:hypothetical protein
MTMLKPRLSRTRVVSASVSVALAAAAVVAWLAEDRGANPIGVVVLCALFALTALYVPSRGDLTSIMAGEADERQRLIDLKAHWFALEAVAIACVAGFFWEQSQDRNGEAFLVVGAVGVLAYLGALTFLRFRS